MSDHRILEPVATLEMGAILTIVGDEAQHAARVKRLGDGDSLQVLDGRGRIAAARIERVAKRGTGTRAEWTLDVRIERVERAEPARPRIEVWSATPKGPRLEEMIDGLSQAGCSLWRPLVCERTAVEPREGKMSRMERVAQESAKQCGRAWIMEIGESIEFVEALCPTASPPGIMLLADAAGSRAADVVPRAIDRAILLVGPEGGFTDREMSRADSAAVKRVRLGPHILRIEVASVIGAAVIGESARG